MFGLICTVSPYFLLPLSPFFWPEPIFRFLLGCFCLSFLSFIVPGVLGVVFILSFSFVPPHALVPLLFIMICIVLLISVSTFSLYSPLFFSLSSQATSVLIPVFYVQVHPMETVPELVPDRATIDRREAGPDADADSQTRAHVANCGLTSSI